MFRAVFGLVGFLIFVFGAAIYSAHEYDKEKNDALSECILRAESAYAGFEWHLPENQKDREWREKFYTLKCMRGHKYYYAHGSNCREQFEGAIFDFCYEYNGFLIHKIILNWLNGIIGLFR